MVAEGEVVVVLLVRVLVLVLREEVEELRVLVLELCLEEELDRVDEGLVVVVAGMH